MNQPHGDAPVTSGASTQDPPVPLGISPTALQRVADVIAGADERPHRPAQIAAYRLVEVLGTGGMGVVYRAEQEHPIRRTVALKLIKPGMDSREVIARFESERQALAMMSHPNLAQVLDAGTADGGRPFFVMEYVPGEPITAYCDRRRYTLEQRLTLFVQACAAVQHAHQKAILHRDLKPSNILVTGSNGDAQVKVIDFGVAKALSQPLTDRTLVTESGQLLGTPEYMSPEQATSGGEDVDTRSDIYSLGVVLYELLTGTLPFDPKALRGSGVAGLQRIIKEVAPPRPSTRLSGVGGEAAHEIAQARQSRTEELTRQLRGELEWIPLKALRKERSERYGSAGELMADIANYLAHRPLMAGPESRVYRLRKFVRRNKGPVAAVAGIAAALVIGLVFTLMGFAQARQERDRALAAERKAEENLQTARTEAARSAQVAQFMTDMLNGVGPSVARGRDTAMLREILDKTAARLDQLKDQPEVEADLRMTLGSVYGQLGERTRATAMSGRALKLRRQLHRGDHAELAKALALAAQGLDDPAARELMLRDALAMRQRLFGEQHDEVAVSLALLAEELVNQGRNAEGEEFYRQALAVRRETGNEVELSVLQQRLSALLVREGRGAEAQKLFSAAVAIRMKAVELLSYQGAREELVAFLDESLAKCRELFGSHPSLLPPLLAQLSLMMLREGKVAEAEALARECLALREEHAPDDWLTAATQRLLGEILLRQQRYEEAERLLLAAYEGTKRSLDQIAQEIHQRHNVRIVVFRLVQLYQATERPDKIDELAREAVAMLEVDEPQVQHQALYLLEGLAMALPRQAEHVQREALTMLRRNPHARSCWCLRTAVYALARTLGNRREFTEARALAEEAVTLLREEPSSGTAERRDAYLLLFEMLVAQGEWTSAMAIQRERTDHVRKRFDAATVAGELAAFTLILLKGGNPTAAEPLARQCLAIHEGKGSNDWLLFHARSLLGGALLGQNRYAEAEMLLLGGYDGMNQRRDQIPSNKRMHLYEAAHRLVQLYEATDRPTEAAQWREELTARQAATQPDTALASHND